MKQLKLLTALGLLALAATVFATDVKVAWDAVPDAVSYRIYRAKPGNESQPMNKTNSLLVAEIFAPQLTYALTNLPRGQMRFAVTSYADGDESPFSESITVKLTTPAAPTNFRIVEVIVK